MTAILANSDVHKWYFVVVVDNLRLKTQYWEKI